MAENPTIGRVMIEGGLDGGRFAGFPAGVDSYSHPLAVSPTQVRWMENGVTQGSFLQTRPGYKKALTFDVANPSPYSKWWNNGYSPGPNKGIKLKKTQRRGPLSYVGFPGFDGTGKYRLRTVSGTMNVSEYPTAGNTVGSINVFAPSENGHPGNQIMLVSNNNIALGDSISLPAAGVAGEPLRAVVTSKFSIGARTDVSLVIGGPGGTDVTVTVPKPHYLDSGDVVDMTGFVSYYAGDNSFINGTHTVQVIDPYIFRFHLSNVSPSTPTTQSGGGFYYVTPDDKYFVALDTAASNSASGPVTRCGTDYPPSGIQTGIVSVFYFFNEYYYVTINCELVGIDSSTGLCTYKFIGHQVTGGAPPNPGAMPPPSNYASLVGHGPISPGFVWTQQAGTVFTLAVSIQQIFGYGIGSFNYIAGGNTTHDVWNQSQQMQDDGSIVVLSDITTREYLWGSVVNPISAAPSVAAGRPDIFYQAAQTIIWPIQPVYTKTEVTNTQKVTSGLGCVPGNLPWVGGGPGAMSAFGSVTQTLSEPDSWDSAVTRFDSQVPWPPWEETTSLADVVTIGGDSEYGESRIQVLIEELVPNGRYRGLIDVYRRNRSSGAVEFVQTVSIDGTADEGGVFAFEYQLPNAEGYDYFISGNGVQYVVINDAGQVVPDTRPIIHPQMAVSFTPSNGTPQLVFAVSGSVWYCNIAPDGSLGEATQIETLQFCPNADQLTGTLCTQTSTIIAGVYANNITPRNLLIIQDGINRAGIWDGQIGVHANPEKKVTIDANGNTLYDSSYNQTRIGLWCAWSGDRLFVFNGRTGFASDLGDPTHFTEELTLNSLQMMVFPEEVTGAIDRGTSGNNQSAVVVCTRTTTWTIYSGIRNRLPSDYGAGWANTPGFVTKIFSGVGCVAGKSMVLHRGLLYWRSLEGLVMFDSVNTVNSTQNLPIIDLQMAYSKRLVTPPNNPSGDLTCAGKRGSYVLWSVPTGPVTNGRCYCHHTQVLDRQITDNSPGWQGIWTGMRPVEWASAIVGGEHTYALSMDGDGVVRIWETFQSNRADNGQRIPWLVETKLERVQNSVFEYANFRHFRLILDQLVGNFDIVGYWRGMRGAYHELLNEKITATPGSVLSPIPGFSEVVNDTEHFAFLPQTRTVISQDVRGVNDVCSSAGVESEFEDGTDHAFSLLLKMRGRGAVVAYRIAVDARPDNTEGRATKNTGVDENGFNIISAAECPKHIDGVTPDYVAGDQPSQLALSPYLPVYDESTLYQSPVS